MPNLKACFLSLALFVPLLGSGGSLPAAACGADSDCRIGDRSYRLAMPAGHDGTARVGAIVYAHGYRSSAAAVMRDERLRALADDLGVALIAGKSAGDAWLIANTPRRPLATDRLEIDFYERMLADAAARFPIDRTRMLATGFSAGGMMVWTLACRRSRLFAGYAPLSGTFWAPVPKGCTSPPASLVHIHGDSDRTVPLTGRPIADTRQGNVFDALAMYAAHGGFGLAKESRVLDLRCRRHRNPAGQRLEFCLFEGGHTFHAAHLRYAWEVLIGRPPP